MSGRSLAIAALGDSITAGTPLWDPDPAVRAGLRATDERSQWTYWAGRSNPGLDFRNFGVDREVTDQIGARLEAAAQGADVLVVQGGINDLVGGRSAEEAAEGVDALVRRASQIVPTVMLVELVPNDNFPGLEQPIRDLNERIRALGRERGIAVLPFYDVLDDPNRPGRFRPGLTDDGNHPSVEGHRLLGERAFRLPEGLRA